MSKIKQADEAAESLAEELIQCFNDFAEYDDWNKEEGDRELATYWLFNMTHKVYSEIDEHKDQAKQIEPTVLMLRGLLCSKYE